jgi:hypothetical protein
MIGSMRIELRWFNAFQWTQQVEPQSGHEHSSFWEQVDLVSSLCLVSQNDGLQTLHHKA